MAEIQISKAMLEEYGLPVILEMVWKNSWLGQHFLFVEFYSDFSSKVQNTYSEPV